MHNMEYGREYCDDPDFRARVVAHLLASGGVPALGVWVVFTVDVVRREQQTLNSCRKNLCFQLTQADMTRAGHFLADGKMQNHGTFTTMNA
jgi:hypothetical protein